MSVHTYVCLYICSLILSSTLKVVDGFQPRNFWCRAIHQNYCKFILAFLELFSKTTGGLQPNWTRGIFRDSRYAFWPNVVWPFFGAKPCFKNYFKFTLAFLELFSEKAHPKIIFMSALSFPEHSCFLLGRKQPNLTGGIFRGLRCAFGVPVLWPTFGPWVKINLC